MANRGPSAVSPENGRRRSGRMTKGTVPPAGESLAPAVAADTVRAVPVDRSDDRRAIPVARPTEGRSADRYERSSTQGKAIRLS